MARKSNAGRWRGWRTSAEGTTINSGSTRRAKRAPTSQVTKRSDPSLGRWYKAVIAHDRKCADCQQPVGREGAFHPSKNPEHKLTICIPCAQLRGVWNDATPSRRWLEIHGENTDAPFVVELREALDRVVRTAGDEQLVALMELADIANEAVDDLEA